MSRSFDVLSESPASVEQIHAAFGREDYWLTRLGAGSSSTLDSLLVAPDGAVTVAVTQHLGRQLLPGMVAKIIPGDLVLTYRESWRRLDDGRVHGQVSVSASGGLGSSRAQNWLAATGDSTQLRSAVRVEVKIPLVGGQLEKSIGTSLAESIPATLRFTTAWIAEYE